MLYAIQFLILLFKDYYGLKENLRKGKVNSEKTILNHITYAQSPVFQSVHCHYVLSPQLIHGAMAQT